MSSTEGCPTEPPSGRRLVPGPILASGLALSAAAILGAAALGWAGVAIIVAALGAGCALLVRWSS